MHVAKVSRFMIEHPDLSRWSMLQICVPGITQNKTRLSRENMQALHDAVTHPTAELLGLHAAAPG